MDNFKLTARNLGKTFDNREWIYKNIDLEIKNQSAIAIKGRNGSGKSTLLKTIAGIIAPSKGDIEFNYNNKKVDKEHYNDYIGLVSPYLNVYEEFTAAEHIDLYLQLKGLKHRPTKAKELLERFSLKNSGEKYISKFSSGMKQRLKFILALITEPHILFLDEPFTNLDESGVQIVEEVMEMALQNNCAIVVASNDSREMRYCNEFIELNPEK